MAIQHFDTRASHQQIQAHSQAVTLKMVMPKNRRAVQTNFPSGFRFLPTDAELVQDYLMKKIQGVPINIEGMREVTLYSFSPDDLAATYPHMGEHQWFFFTSRNRKYKNGLRPNRVAGHGYWKATGKDHNITVDHGSRQRILGYKKSLVYYRGSPQNGTKTNWQMQEYTINAPARTRKHPEDMRLDDVVLCKIYEHGRNEKNGKGGDSTFENSDNSAALVVAGIEVSSASPVAVEAPPASACAPSASSLDFIKDSVFDSLDSLGWTDILRISEESQEEFISLGDIEFTMDEERDLSSDNSAALVVAGVNNSTLPIAASVEQAPIASACDTAIFYPPDDAAPLNDLQLDDNDKRFCDSIESLLQEPTDGMMSCFAYGGEQSKWDLLLQNPINTYQQPRQQFIQLSSDYKNMEPCTCCNHGDELANRKRRKMTSS